MKLALVAMPWSTSNMPSPALGLLSAQVKQSLPEIEVDCYFPYLELLQGIGAPLYNQIAEYPELSEILYAAHLYPQKLEETLVHLRKWIGRRAEETWEGTWEGKQPEEISAQVLEEVGSNIQDTATQLAAGHYDVVGFTTTFAQLFSSLTVARRLKELASPNVILGGMSVAFDSGPSLLQEYGFVDYVVQGEGEERLVGLLSALDQGGIPTGEGVLAQQVSKTSVHEGRRSTFQVLRNEVKDLDALPIPDFDDFAKLAREARFPWILPIEGSRGCWWDRVARTNDPMNICYFCGLNSSSYREKSIDRLVDEMQILSNRYKLVRFQFLDNIIRHRDVDVLTRRIRELGKDLSFFYELRANISSYELLGLWKAGCYGVQIGIEGLSSRYLKRVGKGTTTIQNLQAMRTCFELGIDSLSNLITHFPGTTPEEIEETATNILNYAIYYQPCNLSPFEIYEGSSVSRVPEQFGVSGLRNHDDFKAAIPDDVLDRVRLHFLDFETESPAQNWEAVKEACRKWRQVYSRMVRECSNGVVAPVRPLDYRDGVSFLEITSRVGEFNQYRLGVLQRNVYLHCMEIRSEKAVVERFGKHVGEERIWRMLDTFERRRLMFREKGKCLSLAIAPNPQIAARRIEKAHQEHVETRRRPVSAAVSQRPALAIVR